MRFFGAAILRLSDFTSRTRLMPPAARRSSRSRTRAPVVAASAENIRAALARGARAGPSTSVLSPLQEVAISEWPLADLETAHSAWEELSASSSTLLLLANLRLLPEQFRTAFALPSPDRDVVHAALLTTHVQSILRQAIQFHREQLEAFNAFTVAD